MNITEIARKLKVPTDELREKLPTLGLGYGRNSVKVNDRDANRIVAAWAEMKRRERMGAIRDEQLNRGAAQKAGDAPAVIKDHWGVLVVQHPVEVGAVVNHL